MGGLGRILIAAVGTGLLLQAAATAAPRAATGNWIGSWGYVVLTPPPGAPFPPTATPPAPPGPTPLGVFAAPPPPPPPRTVGPPAAIDNPGNIPVDLTTTDLGNVTVRQVVRVSQGGPRLRLRFSNENSADALPLAAIHVGEAGTDGAVIPGSDHVVTFDGQSSVIVPAGAPVLSDPIDLPTRALEKLYISTYLPGPVPLRAPRTLVQYVAGKPGDFTAAASLPGARLMRIPPYVTLVEVQATPATSVIVALGDSITQGSASTANAFRGWPDRLAERLATQHWAVVNAGIGGNRLLRYGLGPSALSRLDRDVLSVPGLKVIILLEGINDIGVGLGTPSSVEPVTADALESADRQIIARAHEHGVRVIGATLTPYQGAGYSSPAGEMVREALNHWIRSSGAFDGVIDFDKVIVDPQKPGYSLPKYDKGDHLHPNAAGYEVMGSAIDLNTMTTN